MKTVPDIFQAFGGPASVARAIGVSTEHATTMRRRGSIPVRYWPALIEFARSHQIQVNETALMAAHAKTGVAA